MSLATFRAETRAWLEANCPPLMRTPTPADETPWAGRDQLEASRTEALDGTHGRPRLDRARPGRSNTAAAA
jgi:hypothetical protein